jgi:hypothetical protein
MKNVNTFLAQVPSKDSVVNPAIPGGYNRPGVQGNILITEMIGNLLTAALGIATIILLVWIVMGGFEWILSNGEKQGLENARNKITNGIIGLVIIALAVAIFIFIGEVLGINVLKINLPVAGK